MTSLLPHNADHTGIEAVPVTMDEVADTADVARKLLDLASRTSRATQMHPADERYSAIADAIEEAAQAAFHAATLVVEAAARRW